MRRDRKIARLGVLGALVVAMTLCGAAAGYEEGDGPAVPNPCGDSRARELRCPDLTMAPPSHMYVSHGRLHAANNIRSRGKGPMEIRGKRTGRRTMRVNQVIYKLGRGKLRLPTNGQLAFYHVPRQGPYWKFHHAAAFELWTIDDSGNPETLVRTGPKLNYCLRDLVHTKPSKRSPRHRHYPGCSQNPELKHRTLGTSVGWSDVYPSSYDKNWIRIRGLSGCFLFIHRADPENYLYESNETNNSGARRIRIRHGHVGRC
jgi:hypothetical protein